MDALGHFDSGRQWALTWILESIEMGFGLDEIKKMSEGQLEEIIRRARSGVEAEKAH